MNGTSPKHDVRHARCATRCVLILAVSFLVVLIPFTSTKVKAQTSASMGADQPLPLQNDASSDDTEVVARQQLDRILSDPMFHRWEFARDGKAELDRSWLNALMDSADRWREKLIQWIRDQFPRTAKPFPNSEGIWSTAGVVFKAIAYVLGAVLLVFVIIVFVRILRAPVQPTTTRILSRKRLQEALQQGQALATDSSQWITEAMRLAQNDDLRLAYRAMYLALLSGLHQQRSIDFHQQRTNWTYVAQFRGEDDYRKSFAGLTRMFDDVWYGLGQPDAAKLEQVRLQIDSLLKPAARREVKP